MEVIHDSRASTVGQRAKVSKSPAAYRVIGEVAQLLGVTTVTLRNWERDLPHVNPTRMRNGRRHYDGQTIQLLASIKRLLHVERFTIEGIRRLLEAHGVAAVRTQSTFSAQHIKVLNGLFVVWQNDTSRGEYISDESISGMLGVPKHTFRFWEERFPAVVTQRGYGGMRTYRASDMALLQKVAELLLVHMYAHEGVEQMIAAAQSMDAGAQ